MKNIQAKIEGKLAKQSGVSLILVILAMTIMSILMIPLTRWWVNLNGNLNMSEQRVAMQGIAMNQLGDLSQESYEDLIDYFVDGVDPNQGTATSLSEVMNSKTEDGYYTGNVGNDKYVWKLEKIEGVRVVTQYTYGQANESISKSGTVSGGGYFMENGACKYMPSVSYSNVTNQPNPCMLVTVSVSDGTNRDYSQSFYKRSTLLRTWRYVVNRNHSDRRVLGLKELSGSSSSPNFAIDIDGVTHPIYTKAQVDAKFNDLREYLKSHYVHNGDGASQIALKVEDDENSPIGKSLKAYLDGSEIPLYSQGGGFPNWGDYIVVTADQLSFTAPCDGYYVGMMYDNQATNYAVVIPKGELFPEMSSAPFNNGLADNPLKFGHLVAISYVGAGHGSYVFTPLHEGDTIFIHQGRYALQYGGVFYKAKK